VDRLAHPCQLFQAILPRQRGEDGLVEAGRQDLDLPVDREPSDQVEVTGLMRLQPFEQRPGDVQGDGEKLTLLDPLDERPVYVPNMLLEDVIEIPNGLVEVDAEDKAERIQLVTLREAEAP
jgi:hypothetical protein